MNKSYLLIICLLVTPFTGCVGLFEEDLEEEEEKGLKNAIYTLFEDLENGEWESFCKMFFFELEDEIINIANETQVKECVEGDTFGTIQLKYTVNDYKEEETDKTIASNSGPIYEVTMDMEFCIRYDSAESWECETEEEPSYFTKVSGQWIDVTDWVVDWSSESEIYPIISLFTLEDSEGVYHVDVLNVNIEENLENFSFYLKDGGSSTYVGGNGFGEVAMQWLAYRNQHGGYEHGIDMTYDGDDEQLKSRANNVSNDNGTEFPVHFSDNDRDGKLTPGDQFLVYGGEEGPAVGGWRLDIQYDNNGDIVGSAKLGEAENFPVYGCMHMNATNYNEDATEDDGSCVYPVEECELVPYGYCHDEDLSGQDLSEMNLTGIDLSFADLTGANLTGADLTDANLNYADLAAANLTDANLANTSLYNADISGAWLYAADLSGAWLYTADLTDAYLRYANLTDANLTGADLLDARLIGAVLKRADLKNADLTNASLVYGWLGFADFTGAIVTDVDFTYAYWEETIWTDGVVYDCTGLCDSPS